MSKITRKIQKIFGSNAGTNQRGVIGSFAAASPVYSTDVDTMQSLAGYLVGWFNVAAGPTSPCIEDMNSLDYVLSYNVAYLQQTGVAEWYATTTYYIGSIVNDGTGQLYVSLTDANLNVALTNTTNWKKFGNPTVSAITSNTVLTAADSLKVLDVNTAAGSAVISLTLPANAATVAGMRFTVKDVGGMFATYACSMVPQGGDTIEGLAGNYQLSADYGSWTFVSDGVSGWRLI